MSLSLDQIKLILEKRINRAKIQAARLHEDEIRFYAKPVLDAVDLPYKPFIDYKRFVHDPKNPLLPADKAERIYQLTTLPLITVDLMDSIFTELRKVLNAQNSYQFFQFSSPDDLIDWDVYRTEILKDDEFFRNQGWDAFSFEINSIMIVDLPLVQETEKPMPYYFLLSVDNVLEAKPDGQGFEYIIYKYNGGVVVIDDTSYRYFESEEDTVKGKVLYDNPHYLGFCPAYSFWDKLMDKDNLFDKKSVMSNSFGRLKWYLFYDAAKRYNDLSSAFPITVVIEEECDYTVGEESCERGYMNGNLDKPCPACAKRSTLGPGSQVFRPANSPDEKYDKTVERVEVDSLGLDYVKKDLKEIGSDITARIAGVTYVDNVNVAKNSEQMTSLYESKGSVLIKIAESFAKIRKWSNDTVIKLRYNSFIRSSDSFGTEFYFKSLRELYEIYGKAKEDGLPEAQLDAIVLQIYNNRYVNNTDMLEREKLLLAIEPFPHKNQEELEKLLEKDLVSEQDFVIQINFNNFVKRFERENGSIINFGSLLKSKKRHELIFNELKKYADEKTKSINRRTKTLLPGEDKP